MCACASVCVCVRVFVNACLDVCVCYCIYFHALFTVSLCTITFLCLFVPMQCLCARAHVWYICVWLSYICVWLSYIRVWLFNERDVRGATASSSADLLLQPVAAKHLHSRCDTNEIVISAAALVRWQRMLGSLKC